MPLSKIKRYSPHAAWALWRIEEPTNTLLKQLDPSDPGLWEFKQVHHPQKQQEWLASRLTIKELVHFMTQPFRGIYKDAFGKPHLFNSSLHISMAHCYPFAVGAIHRKSPVGIDIEKPREQLLHIRDRFLNESEKEQAGNDLQTLCKFWSSKEVLYKIHGRRRLVFREHLHVELNGDGFKGTIIHENLHQHYQIRFETVEGHFIALSQ